MDSKIKKIISKEKEALSKTQKLLKLDRKQDAKIEKLEHKKKK